MLEASRRRRASTTLIDVLHITVAALMTPEWIAPQRGEGSRRRSRESSFSVIVTVT